LVYRRPFQADLERIVFQFVNANLATTVQMSIRAGTKFVSIVKRVGTEPVIATDSRENTKISFFSIPGGELRRSMSPPLLAVSPCKVVRSGFSSEVASGAGSNRIKKPTRSLGERNPRLHK